MIPTNTNIATSGRYLQTNPGGSRIHERMRSETRPTTVQHSTPITLYKQTISLNIPFANNDRLYNRISNRTLTMTDLIQPTEVDFSRRRSITMHHAVASMPLMTTTNTDSGQRLSITVSRDIKQPVHSVDRSSVEASPSSSTLGTSTIIHVDSVPLSDSRSGICWFVCTVEPRYLELGYLEQRAISNRLPFPLVFL